MYSSRINAFFVLSQSFSCKAFHAAHFIRGQRYVVRPLALQVAAGDFALAAGHDLPTLGFAVVRRRTDGAGGFLLGVSLGIAVTATVV